MSLKTYRAKRDFSKTAEPKGLRVPRKKSTFVVQKHAASHLHYDFRLELDGVLKSWAVPKGPSLDPKQKRLAVEVEDHPLDYANFEGDIPKGEYGGGHVIVWDNGTWVPPKNAKAEIKKGRLEFELKGKKLRGKWILVRTARKSGKKQNWLLIKRHDSAARSTDEINIVEDEPESVLKVKSKTIPEFIRPQLARLVEQPPSGEDWVHEIKYDGYRVLCRIENGNVRFRTRNGHDWTEKFGGLKVECAKLPVENAILDGEIVTVDKDGRSSFGGLQRALSDGRTQELLYYVFDILYHDGVDLKEEPLLKRKSLLKELVQAAKTDRVIFSEHWRTSGNSVLKASCGLKLEGIISKNVNDPYESGRGQSWLKAKCKDGQEFVIGGFTPPEGSRSGFGALLLGVYQPTGELRYVGRVGTGFNSKTLQSIAKKLKAYEIEESPFDIKSPQDRSIRWVEPKLVANVEFGAWTDDGILRHASFQGLRSDKAPLEVSQETPAETAPVRISNADRIVFQKKKITKGRVADYYKAVEKWILPYIEGRPLSVKRCPDGDSKPCFFQKHWETTPKKVRTKKVKSKERNKTEDVFYIENIEGLLELVQMGTLEIHPWGSRINRIDSADRLVFDLDPDESVSWEGVKNAALSLREFLRLLNLESYLMLSGGKGLHLHVPVEPLQNWTQTKAFCKAIVVEMAKRHPGLYTASVSKAKRKGRIFIDYLRNGYGATAVAPYSLRARASASIALPISWAELKSIRSPDQYSLEDAIKFLKKRRADPWKNYLNIKQRVPTAK